MSSDGMKKYLEEVLKNVAMGSPQTFPMDRGVKLMVPPDDIANALVQGGYYADIKKAKGRVMRHLRSDTAGKRAQRCIVSLHEYHAYLKKYNLPQPDASKGYS